MSDSLHAFGGGFPAGTYDAYAEITPLGFGSGDQVYIGFQVYLKAADLAAWAANNRNGPIFALMLLQSGGFGDQWSLYDQDPDGAYDFIEMGYHGDTSGMPTGDAWHTVEYLLDLPNAYGPMTIKLDGTTIATDSFGPGNPFTNPPDKLRFGAMRNGASAAINGDIYFGEIRVGSSDGAFDKFHFDPSTAVDLSAFSSTHGTVSLDTAPSSPPAFGGGGGGGGSTFADDTATDGGAGGVRIGVAFNDTTFEENPEWTFLTALESVRAASYTIDKGKQDEQAQVGATQVVINLFDRDGTLDPTKTEGPYYGLIDALLQVRIELFNPVTNTWHSRFRGFIQDLDYVPYSGSHVDPAGVVEGYYSLQISCVGIMEPITAIELQLGAFGDSPPPGAEGFVFFDNATFQDRITQVWGNAGIPTGWLVAFEGNVEMAESRYSPSDNVMSVVQDAVDAELPTVANAYEDRFGRLAVHGRLAELDPVGTFESTTPDRWDFTEWKAGDERAVLASPTDTAQIREAPFNRGLAHLVNSAFCTPAGIAQADRAGQLSTDSASIAKYGIRSWSKENLYIAEGLLTGNTALEETRAYADFQVANGKNPHNRFTGLTFKSMHPDDERAAPNWDLLCRCDVQDSLEVTITFAGRPADIPNFNLEPFFILGIHEQVTPLTDTYAMVTTRLDVAPRPLETAGLATPG